MTPDDEVARFIAGSASFFDDPAHRSRLLAALEADRAYFDAVGGLAARGAARPRHWRPEGHGRR